MPINNTNTSDTGLHKDEIDLHRLTVEESVLELEPFLYRSFQSGLYRVWVIHGKGSGTLRREVRRYLSKHPLVRTYSDADSHHGGSGATQVELTDR